MDLAGNITLGLPWGANFTQAGMVHFSGPGPTENQALPQSSILIPLGSSATFADWLAAVAYLRKNPPPGIAFHYTNTAAGINNGTVDLLAHRRKHSVAIMVVITGGEQRPPRPRRGAGAVLHGVANAALSGAAIR